MKKLLTIAVAVTIAGLAWSADDAKSLFGKAGAAMKAGNYDEAFATYQQAETASSSKGGKSMAANGAGFALFKARKYAEALPHLQRATETDPTNKVAWNNLGSTHLRMYNLGLADAAAVDAAVAAFTKATELEPSFKADPKWQSENLKDALGVQAEEKKASEARAAAAGKPAPSCSGDKPCREAGDKAAEAGDYAGARACYEKAEAAALSKVAKGSCANSLGLLALNREHNPEAAVAAFRRSVEQNPKSKFAWNNLGIALMRQYTKGTAGKEAVEEAIAAYKKVAEIDPAYKTENLAEAEALLTELGGPTMPAESATPAEDSSAPAEAPAAAPAEPAKK